MSLVLTVKTAILFWRPDLDCLQNYRVDSSLCKFSSDENVKVFLIEYLSHIIVFIGRY